MISRNRGPSDLTHKKDTACWPTRPSPLPQDRLAARTLEEEGAIRTGRAGARQRPWCKERTEHMDIIAPLCCCQVLLLLQTKKATYPMSARRRHKNESFWLHCSRNLSLRCWRLVGITLLWRTISRGSLREGGHKDSSPSVLGCMCH